MKNFLSGAGGKTGLGGRKGEVIQSFKRASIEGPLYGGMNEPRGSTGGGEVRRKARQSKNVTAIPTAPVRTQLDEASEISRPFQEEGSGGELMRRSSDCKKTNKGSKQLSSSCASREPKNVTHFC